jgi:hypothetical protein
MKKTLSASVLPVLLFIALLVLGCGGDDNPPAASCDNAVNKYEDALDAYLADITSVAKCNALKASLNDLVACPGLVAAKKKEYQDAVDAIECD